MPNDFITLNALADELNDKLEGSKINKVNMMTLDAVVLAVRAKGQNVNLMLSASSKCPAVYITSLKQESLDVPPSFCMLLRKYLLGAIIESVKMFNNDRIICISLIAKNELCDTAKYKLLIELTGANSNIVLVDNEFVIIDAIKRVFESKIHTIIPNDTYIPLNKSKPDLSDFNAISSLENIPKTELLNALSKNISGLSAETAKECYHLHESSNGDKTVCNIISSLLNVYNSGLFKPCAASNGVYIYPYNSLNGQDIVHFDSLNLAMDYYYGKLSLNEQKQNETKDIRASVKRLRSRLNKKLLDNSEKLSNSSKIEHLLQQAEILKCNIHNIKNGYSILNCYDFYNNIDIGLPIDTSVSPKKNLEAYYKRYTKLKGMVEYAKKEKTELEIMDKYLSSIELSLELASLKSDYNDLKIEINSLLPSKSAQIGKKQNNKQPKIRPLEFTIDGFKVYIGKTNLQNDFITFKLANSSDLWLHVKDYHGCHAIIASDNKQIPESVIKKAASLTAFYSQAQKSSKAEVDYTKRQYVKRLSKPGLVNYTNHKTILVEPKQLD